MKSFKGQYIQAGLSFFYCENSRRPCAIGGLQSYSPEKIQQFKQLIIKRKKIILVIIFVVAKCMQ